MRKHSIRSWRKTSVLRQPIKNRHVENIKSTLKPLSKQIPNRTKEENQLSDKSSRLRLCFLLHHRHIDRRSRTISKNNKFSPYPLLPPLGLCPLLKHTWVSPSLDFRDTSSSSSQTKSFSSKTEGKK